MRNDKILKKSIRIFESCQNFSATFTIFSFKYRDPSGVKLEKLWELDRVATLAKNSNLAHRASAALRLAETSLAADLQNSIYSPVYQMVRFRDIYIVKF